MDTLSFERGSKRTPNRPPGGFTLIELLVVIAIVSILSAIAAPSFSSMIARQRVQAFGSDLFVTLLSARSAAIAKNSNVTVSPKNSAWTNGWQTLDVNNTVLDDRNSTLNISLSNPPASVVYGPSGRLPAGTTASFSISAQAGSVTAYECVSVDPSGRPYMKANAAC